MPIRTLLASAGLLALAGLTSCAGENDFEASCRAAGYAPGTAAWTRCLDEAYEENRRLSNRYRSGGP